MEFGSVLRKMRRVADLSQEELAEKLYMSRSSVAKLETNRVELKAETMINWCRITNHPEILMAFIYGTEVVTGLAGVTQFISTIFLGGII